MSLLTEPNFCVLWYFHYLSEIEKEELVVGKIYAR